MSVTTHYRCEKCGHSYKDVVNELNYCTRCAEQLCVPNCLEKCRYCSHYFCATCLQDGYCENCLDRKGIVPDQVQRQQILDCIDFLQDSIHRRSSVDLVSYVLSMCSMATLIICLLIQRSWSSYDGPMIVVLAVFMIAYTFYVIREHNNDMMHQAQVEHDIATLRERTEV